MYEVCALLQGRASIQDYLARQPTMPKAKKASKPKATKKSKGTKKKATKKKASPKK